MHSTDGPFQFQALYSSSADRQGGVADSLVEAVGASDFGAPQKTLHGIVPHSTAGLAGIPPSHTHVVLLPTLHAYVCASSTVKACAWLCPREAVQCSNLRSTLGY